MRASDAIDKYLNSATSQEVADEMGVSISTVRRIMVAAGIMRSRKQGIAIASSKGRMGRKYGSHVTMSESGKIGISEGRRAYLEKYPPTGITLKQSGYVAYTIGPHKGQLEHRVIASLQIGRQLLPKEVVHHEDGNKTNNTPSNLRVMDWSAHSSMHALEHGKARNRNTKGQFK